VPKDVLDPRHTWSDKEAYDHQASRLTDMFVENFKTFEVEESMKDICKGGPKSG